MNSTKPRFRVKMRRQSINDSGLKLFDLRDAMSMIKIDISPSDAQLRMAKK